MVARAWREQPWCHDHHSTRSRRPAGARGPPGHPGRAEGARPDPPHRRPGPQGRRGRRRPGPPPRHRPGDPARRVRRAGLLRRVRPPAVRRLLAPAPRGRCTPRGPRARRAQPRRGPGGRGSDLRAVAARRLHRPVRLPVAAGADRRHRPGRPGVPRPGPPRPAHRAADPTPAGLDHRAVRAGGAQRAVRAGPGRAGRPADGLRPAAAQPAAPRPDPVLVHDGPGRARRGCPRHLRPRRRLRRRPRLPRDGGRRVRPDAARRARRTAGPVG